MIRHTTPKKPARDRAPRADGSLADPEGATQRRRDRKHSTAPGAAPTQFCDDGGYYGQRQYRLAPASDKGEHHKQRHNGQGGDEADRPRELVVCLANSLAPEVPCFWWEAANVKVLDAQRRPARGLNGSNEFEVLEQYVAVVSASAHQRRSTNGQRPGPIAARHAIDEHAGRVESRMPGKWVEEVLWSNDVDKLQAASHSLECVTGIPDVVICDHQEFVRGQPEPCQDAADLSVGQSAQVRVGGDVPNAGDTTLVHRAVHNSGRGVDQEHFRPCGQLVDVLTEFR